MDCKSGDRANFHAAQTTKQALQIHTDCSHRETHSDDNVLVVRVSYLQGRARHL